MERAEFLVQRLERLQDADRASPAPSSTRASSTRGAPGKSSPLAASVVTYTSLLSGHARSGDLASALDVFCRRMPSRGDTSHSLR